MIHDGNGRFLIEPEDWGHIITWPSPNDYAVAIWERPILSPELALWFSERNIDDIKLIFNMDRVAKSIMIRDQYLATEFRLRWCRQYETCHDKDYAWRFCDVKFQGIIEK